MAEIGCQRSYQLADCSELSMCRLIQARYQRQEALWVMRSVNKALGVSQDPSRHEVLSKIVGSTVARLRKLFRSQGPGSTRVSYYENTETCQLLADQSLVATHSRISEVFFHYPKEPMDFSTRILRTHGWLSHSHSRKPTQKPAVST